MQRIMPNQIKNSSQGFTVLELSFVLLISAILMAAALSMFNIYKKTIMHEQAKEAIQGTTVAINNFYLSQKRYPCPANPTLTPANANYGLEDCTMATVPGATTPLTVLIGLVPLYVQTTDMSSGAPVREKIALNQYTDKTTVKNFPFNDPWGQRLTYAVTKELTGDANGLPLPERTTDRKRGTIALVDEFGRNTGGTNGDADYVVVSHGADAIGAHIDRGATIGCDAAYTLERENCNGDSKFMQGLISSNDQTPAKYFDDYVGFNRTVSATLWAQRDSTEDTIYNVGDGNVGIGITTAPTARLEVEGALQADNITAAQKVCNAAGECMKPESIYDIQCPEGEVIDRVTLPDGNMTARCVELTILDNTAGKQACDDIQVLQGIYSNGGIECSK